MREDADEGMPVEGGEKIVVVNVDWLDDDDNEDDDNDDDTEEGVAVVGEVVDNIIDVEEKGVADAVVAVVDEVVDDIIDVEEEGVADAVVAVWVDAGEVEPPKVHTPFVPSGI